MKGLRAQADPPTCPRPRLSGFRLRARRGNALFRAGLQAPEVHPAPISVTTGGSSQQQKCKPPAVLRSLPPAALRGGCTAPQIPWSSVGPPAARTPGPCGSMSLASPVAQARERIPIEQNARVWLLPACLRGGFLISAHRAYLYRRKCMRWMRRVEARNL